MMSAFEAKDTHEFSSLISQDVEVGCRGRRAMLYWYGSLKNSINHPDTRAFKMTHLSREVRRHAFMLEGLLRLYKRKYPKFEKRLEKIKALEDQLGACDYWHALLHDAVEVNLDLSAQRYIEGQLRKEQISILRLIQQKWSLKAEKNSLKKFRARIEKEEWPSNKGDAQFLAKELRRCAMKISELDLDMNQLEEGIHELRRQIRWLSIYFFALRGFVRLDPRLNPIPEYEALLSSPIASHPYARLPVDDIDNQTRSISKSLYLRLTEAIDHLGRIKDQGQRVEGLANALVQSGEFSELRDAEKDIRSRLNLSNDEEQKRILNAQKLYRELRHHRFFEVFTEPFAS